MFAPGLQLILIRNQGRSPTLEIIKTCPLVLAVVILCLLTDCLVTWMSHQLSGVYGWNQLMISGKFILTHSNSVFDGNGVKGW